MSHKNLFRFRTFVNELARSDQLQFVDAEVDKDWELACVARWVIDSVPASDIYALQFNRIARHNEPVIVGLYSTRKLYAQALTAETEQILTRWAGAMQQPRPWTVVDDGPVLEVVETKEVDLTAMPVPVWTPGHDAGPYLSSAGVITKDRNTGVQNLAVYRVQIHNERQAGLFFGSDKQHGAMHFAKYIEAGEPMPVALVIGASPAVSFAAAAKTQYGVDELHTAGGLADCCIPVVKCRTVDLHVPVDAEYVIEGFVDPDQRMMEAPFGEGLGFVNAAAPAPVINVSAVCRRASPLFHGYVQQLPPSEGHLIWELGAIGPLWYYLTHQLRIEEISDLSIVPGAAGLSMLAVQIKSASREQVRKLLTTVGSVNFGQKFVVVVDDDIDIHDSETLHWAISTRVDPQHDVRVLEDIKTYMMDPSIIARNNLGLDRPEPGPFSSSMMLIDATRKSRVPPIALPERRLMKRALDRWPELGLPELTPRARLERLLAKGPLG